MQTLLILITIRLCHEFMKFPVFLDILSRLQPLMSIFVYTFHFLGQLSSDRRNRLHLYLKNRIFSSWGPFAASNHCTLSFLTSRITLKKRNQPINQYYSIARSNFTVAQQPTNSAAIETSARSPPIFCLNKYLPHTCPTDNSKHPGARHVKIR